jgi:prephenate dehydrogenase
MNIGILGLGAVGQSFVDVTTKYGNGHQLYVYDKDPGKMKPLQDYRHIHACGSEEEVGRNADFLLCCTDMLSGDALTKAAREMRDGKVVSDDFSAKTPALAAYKASGRQLPYWSIHTMFSPKTGFKGQLIIEIPARYCMDGGKENPYITEFRNTLAMAGAHFKKIFLVSDHDNRMGRIQGATSAENICTARTLAELSINPLKEGAEVYSNVLDKVNFQMALRAIGEAGSSNSSVYGLIAMMNPYSLSNIRDYLSALETLIETAGKGEKGARDMLETTMENLGPGRIDEASASWNKCFGPVGETGNSYSSHLAEAIVWSRPKEYPLEIFAETPSPPYRIREVMALKALSMYQRCIRNMRHGRTHDQDFLGIVRKYKDWAERAFEAVNDNPESGHKLLGEFEGEFFVPAREFFSDELVDIGRKTNELIKRLM